MTDATLLAVANSTDRESGYVGERFAQRGLAMRQVLRDEGDTPPTVPPGTSAVLLLGSAWSVADPVEEEALQRECSLVRSALQSGVPVLGLCYGAQVLAHATGGRVARAAQPEVGLVTVDSVDERLVPVGPWWAFHYDVITASPTAETLARNHFGLQAFRLPGALGVQFHPEVVPETLDDWLTRFPDMLAAGGGDKRALVAEARRREPQARVAAHRLVDDFLDRVA
ncbi:MAG TPA: gamma-glutamyl-gamma-aminobutyrate hydrolase family protein [Nocardioidaceae bacterium]|nr:gamma-glutamyl-gamma-aminobutyrate hydrolase family protein [Nocardioidaceae bacterium]